VLWLDSTFAALRSFYQWYDTLCECSLRNAEIQQKQLLDRADLVFFSSEWALESAVKSYGCDRNKLRVAYFGAGIDTPSQQRVAEMIDARPLDVCKLLFLGVEWERKGASKACNVLRQLHASGIAAELTIVGCTPPGNEELPANCTVLPFVSKSTLEGSAAYEALLARAHFLIVPSKADCTPIVFADASAYGLPTLSSDVGGISAVVRTGKNGALFGPNAPAEAYSEYITEVWRDKQRYRELCICSYQEHVNRLNWDVAVDHVLTEVKKVLHGLQVGVER
jgi:glycosyltransferase involved in cell wall biosynthesis